MEAVMNFLDSVVGTVNTLLWDNLLMYLLVLTGIYFTFRLRFIQVRKFGAGMKALFGNFSLNGGSQRIKFFSGSYNCNCSPGRNG